MARRPFPSSALIHLRRAISAQPVFLSADPLPGGPTIVGPTRDQRQRRWTRVEPAIGQCFFWEEAEGADVKQYSSLC